MTGPSGRVPMPVRAVDDKPSDTLVVVFDKGFWTGSSTLPHLHQFAHGRLVDTKRIRDVVDSASGDESPNLEPLPIAAMPTSTTSGRPASASTGQRRAIAASVSCAVRLTAASNGPSSRPGIRGTPSARSPDPRRSARSTTPTTPSTSLSCPSTWSTTSSSSRKARIPDEGPDPTRRSGRLGHVSLTLLDWRRQVAVRPVCRAWAAAERREAKTTRRGSRSAAFQVPRAANG